MHTPTTSVSRRLDILTSEATAASAESQDQGETREPRVDISSLSEDLLSLICKYFSPHDPTSLNSMRQVSKAFHAACRPVQVELKDVSHAAFEMESALLTQEPLSAAFDALGKLPNDVRRHVLSRFVTQIPDALLSSQALDTDMEKLSHISTCLPEEEQGALWKHMADMLTKHCNKEVSPALISVTRTGVFRLAEVHRASTPTLLDYCQDAGNKIIRTHEGHRQNLLTALHPEIHPHDSSVEPSQEAAREPPMQSPAE